MLTTPSISSMESLDTSDNAVAQQWFQHASAPRIDTDLVVFRAVQARHPSANITIVSQGSCNLLAYAADGRAFALPVKDSTTPSEYHQRFYVAPAKRVGGHDGLADVVLYGEYKYAFEQHEFHVYLADGRDGMASYPTVRNYYIVGDKFAIDELLVAIGRWQQELHEQIWVFNQGFWQKDSDLYESIKKASWADVILDEDMKKSVMADVDRFFDSKDIYADLRVPWKRGLIFHGPPGNGKTISIKAIANSLYARKDPVPMLIVRTLAGYGGPERSMGLIFGKARQQAPCLLVFEDLDSVVTEKVRSFFLNEVDGLGNNDGILIIGTTNHLDRIDPGIAKRPSRFDRKYLYPDPNLEERAKYCEFWKRKLRNNKNIEFPQRLCRAIASITDGFSFAYIQEAFVASLLEIANGNDAVRTPSRTEPALRTASRDARTSAKRPLFGACAVSTCLWSMMMSVLYSAKVAVGGPLIMCTLLIAIGFGMDLYHYAKGVTASASTGSPDLLTTTDDRQDDDLDHNILWLTIQKQVKILRDALGDGGSGKESLHTGITVGKTITSFALASNVPQSEDPELLLNVTVGNVGKSAFIVGLVGLLFHLLAHLLYMQAMDISMFFIVLAGLTGGLVTYAFLTRSVAGDCLTFLDMFT